MKLDTVRSIRLAVLVIVVIVLIILGKSSVFSVKESEQAVISTFGKYTRTVQAGLQFKLPWPIQSATVLPVNMTQKIELGYYSDSSGQYYSIPEESMMITNDLNIVNIDFFVEWKISDPFKYLYTTEDPQGMLKSMLQSTVRSIVGTRSIDDVLTTGKIAIQSDVEEMLKQRLSENDIGLMVLDVKVNDSEPPTEEVSKAFRDVETAKQDKETAINQALEYKNSEIPAANAEADKILRAAEAEKESKINAATGEKNRFLAMYNEYKNFPKITRERMYLEVLEAILPDITVYIDDGTSIEKLLPLGEMSSAEAAAAAGN